MIDIKITENQSKINHWNHWKPWHLRGTNEYKPVLRAELILELENAIIIESNAICDEIIYKPIDRQMESYIKHQIDYVLKWFGDPLNVMIEIDGLQKLSGKINISFYSMRKNSYNEMVECKLYSAEEILDAISY